MDQLEAKLKLCHPDSVKLIVTDGIFSMEGDIVPLPEMVALAEKYNADIMVDDAHALGVLGNQGRGTANFGRSETPIIPLFVRNSEKAFWLCNKLLENGVFVTPVIAPAVPENDALIRFSLMATHTFGQVDEAIDKITKAFKEAEIY